MWIKGTNHKTPLMKYFNVQLVSRCLNQSYSYLFNIKHVTRTLALDKNSCSDVMFLRVMRDALGWVHIHPALLHLLPSPHAFHPSTALSFAPSIRALPLHVWKGTRMLVNAAAWVVPGRFFLDLSGTYVWKRFKEGRLASGNKYSCWLPASKMKQLQGHDKQAMLSHIVRLYARWHRSCHTQTGSHSIFWRKWRPCPYLHISHSLICRIP